MTDVRDPNRSLLAAEYALGLLDGDALEAAKAQARDDPHFAREVARWHGRLAPLLNEITPAEPPPGLWARIKLELGAKADNDNAPRLRRRLVIWQSVAAAMTAIAAVLTVVLVQQPRTIPTPVHVERQPAPPLVAVLGNDQEMNVVASWDPAARQLVLAVAHDMRADPAHAHELWVIPPGGKPRSLGTMPARKQMHMRLAAALARLLQQGATIAISVEPPGGSPTGQPTGPVIAAGSLKTA